MNSSIYRGVVREFDATRGRGVIQTEAGECFPVRYSAIVGKGLRTLRSGDRVSFDIELNGRGPNAIRVTRD